MYFFLVDDEMKWYTSLSIPIAVHFAKKTIGAYVFFSILRRRQLALRGTSVSSVTFSILPTIHCTFCYFEVDRIMAVAVVVVLFVVVKNE